MFSTVEVRWFHRGVLLPEVSAWFRQLKGEPINQPPRIDHYLRLIEGDSLGIKLREGRVEIKQRHRQDGVIGFHERVAGVVEHWRKWSFELAKSDGTLPGVTSPTTAWIAVNKTRQLRRYRLTDDKRIVPVSTESPSNQGCDLELTNIIAEGEVWWSVGFEAFGEETTLRENLWLVVKHVLADESPRFEAEDSFGYPRWLAMGPGG